MASWHLVQDILEPKGTCLTHPSVLNDKRKSVKSGSRKTTGSEAHFSDHTSNSFGRGIGACAYIYSLEKQKGTKKHVDSLLAEVDTPLTDAQEMQEERALYVHVFSLDSSHSGTCQALWNWPPVLSMETGDSWSCRRRFRQGR